MKIHDVEQGTDTWHRLRLGIPTASNFKRIICPSKAKVYLCPPCGLEYERKRKYCEKCGGSVETVERAKVSDQSDQYAYQLIAERYYGAPLPDPSTMWMDRGNEMEPYAVKAYEFESGNKAYKVGFVTIDSGAVGCSPDRLVGEDGGLEIKCPSAAIHVRHMVKRQIDDEHKPQIQGNMLICERQWWDVVSYHPGFPPVIIRCQRDEEYIAALSDMLTEFVENMAVAWKLIERTYGVPEISETVQAASDPMGVSVEDVDLMIAAGTIKPQNLDRDEPF